MDINITLNELKLLALLDEQATGYTEGDLIIGKKLEPVLKEMNYSEPHKEFRKALTFLASFQLLGIRQSVFENSGGSSAEITGIWVTGIGTNYLRQLEVELNKQEHGKVHKLTGKAVSLLGSVGQAVAIKVLTDYANSHIGQLAGVVSHLH
jgi:hypothetical protein